MAAQHHKNRDVFHNIWRNDSMKRRCNQTENLIVSVEKNPNVSNMTVHYRNLCNYLRFNT